MSELLLFPIFIDLINSILSSIYTRNFLREKYTAKTTLYVWTAVCFFLQFTVLGLLGRKYSIDGISDIFLSIGIFLILQFLFFEKDLNKQMFAAFSFVAGAKTIRYISGVFWFALEKPYSTIMNYLTTGPEHPPFWTKIFFICVPLIFALQYALLLFIYLHLISRKFVRKDYRLQTYENIFLLLPCIAALCISVTIKIMIVSVENGITMIIYDNIPAGKFWIPVICTLMLGSIVASVALFQKLVQYNEEIRTRILLEHYIGTMEQNTGRPEYSCQTGNPITDRIIHQKIQEAQKLKIPFQVDFAYPPKLSIDVYDIAVILNNALENAVEACYQTEGERQIRLRSYVKDSLFFIEVENSFSREIVIDEISGLPISSKKNSTLHGIGISNIQRCAKNYMGDIDIVISDTGGRKKFSLTVMMHGTPAAAK